MPANCECKKHLDLYGLFLSRCKNDNGIYKVHRDWVFLGERTEDVTETVLYARLVMSVAEKILGEGWSDPESYWLDFKEVVE
jgi:hypothetical protein